MTPPYTCPQEDSTHVCREDRLFYMHWLADSWECPCWADRYHSLKYSRCCRLSMWAWSCLQPDSYRVVWCKTEANWRSSPEHIGCSTLFLLLDNWYLLEYRLSCHFWCYSQFCTADTSRFRIHLGNKGPNSCHWRSSVDYSCTWYIDWANCSWGMSSQRAVNTEH